MNLPPPTTHPGNNFDAIRIVAAALVLYSHHFALTGQSEPKFLGTHSLGGLAVIIFFVISGYLVTASWYRDPNLWRFTLRRVLRIWPALTVVVLLSAYGLGAWVTELPLRDYLAHGATADYLQALAMKIHFVLPGVFNNNPFPSSVNGSLWTIPLEVRCYIVLGLAGLLGLLKYRPIFLASIALYMAWYLFRSNADVMGFVHYGRELSAFFLAGAALQALESSWSRRPALWALVLGGTSALTWSMGGHFTSLLIGLPFAILYVATSATPYIRRAGRWGDPSYGIYLFAFPIQQTIILYLWPQGGFWYTLALALLITVACAYASWHLIEKQALKFKPSSHRPYSISGFLAKWRSRTTATKLSAMSIPKLAESPRVVMTLKVCMLLLLILASILRFHNLGGFSFWDDELFSIATVTRSGPWNGPLLPDRSLANLQVLDSFWTWKLTDPHPPLYEMLLVPWLALLGVSEFAARSLSVVFGLLTLLSAYALPRSINWQTRALYMLMLAVSGCLLIYSQEARNYAMCACISAWMLAWVLRQAEEAPEELREGKPSLFLLALAGLLALTHYYGLIFALSIAAFTAIKVRSPKAFMHLCLRWFLALLPTFAYMGLGWVGILTKLKAAPPQALSLAMTFKRNVIGLVQTFVPGTGNSTSFWLFMLVVLLGIFIFMKMRASKHPLFSVAGSLAGILALFFLVQVLGTRRAEFFHERYLIFIVPGCLLLVSLFTQVKGWPRAVSGLLLLCLIPTGLMIWKNSPQPQNAGEWRGASQLVSSMYKPGDVILTPVASQFFLTYFQHYLLDQIPQDELDKKMWAIAQPAVAIEKLRERKNPTQNVIVYTHAAFGADLPPMLQALKNEMNCNVGEIQSIGNLRVVQVACHAP
jgi:peptidoglycan/LPS O-acetylase OafA/YrhL